MERITFKKRLNLLDKFVLEFTKILDELKIDYVIVAGYVAIFFGRLRITEDIDILIKPLSKEKFKILYKTLIKNKFWILNAKTEELAYKYISTSIAIRITKRKKIVPNIELKFAKNVADFYSLENYLQVLTAKNKLRFSPLELQIAYKLFLGSEKDLEDARFLYKFFKEKLNISKLNRFIEDLKVKDRKKYLE